MKVVVVASLAFSLVNFRGRLLADMVAAGHEVVACAPDDDAAVAGALRTMGVAYRTVPMARTGLNPLADLRTLASLVRLFARELPDLVLAYTQKPIIYSGIATRIGRRARFFAMVSGLGHAFEENGSRSLKRLVSTLYRAALRSVETVFVFNDDDRGEMMRHGIIGSRTSVVRVPGSGVDLKHFEARPVPDGPLRFLLIARLLRSKGLFDYVEAARRVRSKAPECRFALLGPPEPGLAGIDRAQLDAWRAEGLIDYLGETRDVRPHLAAASVFVLPSWYREGLPRTILEAMATGRAVITTDMPGCREPIDQGGNGFLVPRRDPAALAAAMLRFAADPKLAVRMGERARVTAENRFAVERVNEILLATMCLRNGDSPRREARSSVTSRLADAAT